MKLSFIENVAFTMFANNNKNYKLCMALIFVTLELEFVNIFE